MKAVRRGFIKSIPILCSYLFVGMAYGMGVLGLDLMNLLWSGWGIHGEKMNRINRRGVRHF